MVITSRGRHASPGNVWAVVSAAANHELCNDAPVSVAPSELLASLTGLARVYRYPPLLSVAA